MRLKQFDISTAEGRSKERYRRIALTAISSGFAKIVTILTTLITVPLALNYLGVERYGLWMAMSSVFAMLGFADLGIGNGLMQAVSEANGHDNRQAALRFVSSGFFILLGIAALGLVAFLLAYPHIPWPKIFNVSSKLGAEEAGPAMAILFFCLAINIPLGVAPRTQLAYQKGFVANLWQSLGSLLGLAGILLVIHYQAGLPYLVLALVGSPCLALFINGLVFFGLKHPWLRPRARIFDYAAAQFILKTGLLFFLLQAAGALSYQSDNLIVAQVLGPGTVTQYAIIAQLFMFTPIILGFVFLPLWPAYREAIVRGDIAWVKKTFLKSIILGFSVNIPAAVLLIVFGKKIIYLWVGPQVTPSFALLLGWGIFIVLNSLGGPFAMFLNGVNVIRFQVICAGMMLITKLVFSLTLIQLIGLPGVIFGTIMAQVICIFIPYACYIPRLFSSLVQAASSS